MDTTHPDKPHTETVHIIGAGLIGASIGLALRQHGYTVTLADSSATALALAADYGAGVPAGSTDAEPGLVIVATPPEHVAATVCEALQQYPQAVVTDVASVKLQPLQSIRERGADLSRYVGSHPMAGREKGGAIMARADLCVGRPWAICAAPETSAAAVRTVQQVALAVGAVPSTWTAAEHDRAVAIVSHLPQVAASALAAQLTGTAQQNLDLAGAGLRDTTRVAGSDPELWVQILTANSAAVLELLRGLRQEIDEYIVALTDPAAPGARGALAQRIAAGNAGVAMIPGKHGGRSRFAQLNVIVADAPGQLAKLFSDLDELEINLEDMRLEHSPGAQIGFVELSVLPEVRERAVRELEERAWRIV